MRIALSRDGGRGHPDQHPAAPRTDGRREVHRTAAPASTTSRSGWPRAEAARR
ncbi:MAG: hypothetical protein MZW92_34325 [Comamonadaceae bacterium]|nr:hypothetical protein [Comamonadaceae bacterium]